MSSATTRHWNSGTTIQGASSVSSGVVRSNHSVALNWRGVTIDLPLLPSVGLPPCVRTPLFYPMTIGVTLVLPPRSTGGARGDAPWHGTCVGFLIRCERSAAWRWPDVARSCLDWLGAHLRRVVGLQRQLA